MGTRGLSEDQLAQFHADGYLVVDDLIDEHDHLDPMVAEYAARLDELADRLVVEGAISERHEGLPFGVRLSRIYAEAGRTWSGFFDFSLPLRRRAEPDEPCFFPDSVFGILRHRGVLDVVESLIGGEIYSNPVQHVRLKPPERVVPDTLDADRGAILASPWHQDASVVVEEADRTEMITVWIPVFDATEENGCLQVVPRNHLGGLLEHCPAPAGKYLSTTLFDHDRAVALPMRRGSALFMTRMTPHASLSNTSDEVRWSMDLRYNPVGQPTGRPEFPGFVARSRKDPDSELRDPQLWRESWYDARRQMSSHDYVVGKFARSWSGVGCA